MVSKLKTMREEVKEDMKHIPRGNYEQNEFRMIYWFKRMNSKGKKAQLMDDKRAVLRAAVEKIKHDYPNIVPQFDKSYFR